MAGGPSDPDLQMTDAPEPGASDAGETPASSPEAETQDAEPSSVFDVVKRAAEEQGEGEEASSASEEGEASSGGEGEGKETAQEDDDKSSESDGQDQKPDDYSDVPFHQHPRFQQLVKERNEFRQQAQSMQTDAKAFQAVRSFAEEHGLDQDHISNALTAAAHQQRAGITLDESQELLAAGVALKQGDFKTFAQIVGPRFEEAQQALGQRLPEDLQSKVNDGLLDEETAKEVAVLRSQKQQTQGQMQRTEQQRQQQQQRELRGRMQNEVQRWEAAERQRDPDFDELGELREAYARSLIAQHGSPTNVAEAVELAQVSHERAKAQAKRLGGTRRRQGPTPRQPTSTSTANEPAPEPTSVQDAIFAAARAKG